MTVEGKISRYCSSTDEVVEYLASPADYTLHSICAWDSQCVVAGYNSTSQKSIFFLYNGSFDLVSKYELFYQQSHIHTLCPLSVDGCQLLLAVPLAHPYTFTVFNVSSGSLQKVRQLAKKGGIAKVTTGGRLRYVDKENYGAVEVEKNVIMTFGENYNVHRIEFILEEARFLKPNPGIMSKFGCSLI